MGATFVARSFSGDKEQLVPLIKGAMRHHGAALIDVISPCVAFNNHAGSTKSYDHVRSHNEAVNRLDFIPHRDAITTTYAPGEAIEVTQHDGSVLRLRKLADGYDAGDRLAAMTHLAAHESRRPHQRITDEERGGHLQSVSGRSREATRTGRANCRDRRTASRARNADRDFPTTISSSARCPVVRPRVYTC